MFQLMNSWPKRFAQTLFASGLALALLSGCNSSNVKDLSANAQFQAALDDAVARGLPAVSVTIKGRNIDFSGVAGVSDRESGEAVLPDHRFYVASTSKTFVAATLVQMAGDGLLGLDDPITRWLPQEIHSRIPSSDRMSVRMLLNHTTGIFDFQNDAEAWDQEFFLVSEPERHWSQYDALPFFLDKPLHFEPGSDYSYSNSNYILVALIIESASGQTLAQTIRQRIIEPLGLSNTYQGYESANLPGLVHGYYNDEGELFDVHPWYSHYGMADGGIQTTSRDLARFVASLVETDLVLDETMKAEMFRPSGLGAPTSTYGLGINVRAVGEHGELLFTHSGKDPGYQAEMLYVAGKETVITLCASGSFGEYDEIAQQLLVDIFTLLQELQE